MAKTRFASVDEYLAAQPAPARTTLGRVRGAIRKAVPAAEEKLSYQMPAYTLEGVPLLYVAGWKAHYSLYPATDELMAAFKKELGRYERSKGTIRIPYTDPMPPDLVARIARFRADQIAARAKKGRGKGPEAQLDRIRRLCATLPGVHEKLSHGAPTFFVDRNTGSFAIFANNHHEDGHLAVWLPVREGLQPLLIEDAPRTYFNPPYVGTSGWVGIELSRIRDDALRIHLQEAWELVARKRKKGSRKAAR